MIVHALTFWIAEQRRILDWLNPIDYQENLRQVMMKKAQRTGEWLLDHETFRSWVQQPWTPKSGSFVWMYSGPGSGKSVLSSTAIDYLQRQKTESPDMCVTYFHCLSHDSRTQTIAGIIGGLLAQIMTQCSKSLDILVQSHKLADQFGRHRFSELDQPLSLFLRCADILETLYIVIDGLDESSQATDIARFLCGHCVAKGNAKVIAFSRDLPEIREIWAPVAQLELPVSAINCDIQAYLSWRILEIAIDDPSDQDRIINELTRKSDGMFLWAHLAFENLKGAANQTDLEKALHELPAGTDDLFSTILVRFEKRPPQHCRLARNILKWVCYSTRPLVWQDLQIALALQLGDTLLDENKKPFKKLVLNICRPLVKE